MNVNQLRDLIENLDGDVEIRLMTQSNYPFEYSVQGAIDLESLNDWQIENRDPDSPLDLFEPASENSGYFGRCPGILYLLEGTQLGYGTTDAWSADEDYS